MSTSRLRATRIGAHAQRYLSEESRAGNVVSVFRHGFNVLFDQGADARFVSYQTQDIPLHPWAIELPSTPPLLQAKCACYTRGKLTRFSSGLITHFAGATVHELRIRPWDQEELLRALHNKPLVDATVKAMFPSKRPLQLEASLLSTLVRRRLPGDSHLLGELIGLGCGSTPAGDDVLLGMLAALTAQATASEQARLHLSALRAELHSINLLELTTRASSQMLNAALAGSFPESLCVLVSELKRESPSKHELQLSTDQVLEIGATSGWFFLMGFMATFPNSDTPLAGLSRGMTDID